MLGIIIFIVLKKNSRAIHYRPTKGSSIIVIIFTSVHSVRWGEGIKGDRRLF